MKKSIEKYRISEWGTHLSDHWSTETWRQLTRVHFSFIYNWFTIDLQLIYKKKLKVAWGALCENWIDDIPGGCCLPQMFTFSENSEIFLKQEKWPTGKLVKWRNPLYFFFLEFFLQQLALWSKVPSQLSNLSELLVRQDR